MYTTVHSITNTSAVVDWSRPTDPNGVIDGYHLYFLNGNVTDVKTIRSKDPRIEYNLTDLSPSSMYYVWIRAFTWKHEGDSSNKLSVRTDVRVPVTPSVTNVTCLRDNKVRVQWTSCTWSCVYTVTVTNDNTRDEIMIRVNSTAEDSEVMEADIEVSSDETSYSIGVMAASVSIYRSEMLYESDWSIPVHLNIQDGCQMSFAPRIKYHYKDDTDTITEDTSSGLIAGIVITLVLILIILSGIIIWNKFCKESYYYLDESGGSVHNNIATQWEIDVTHRVTAEQFLAQVKNLHMEGDKEFVVHFKNVTHSNRTVSNPCSYEQPFFVDGFSQPKAFMASPLPLPYKFNFFWKQIWEQKVSVIVMLENNVENGKVEKTNSFKQ